MSAVVNRKMEKVEEWFKKWRVPMFRYVRSKYPISQSDLDDIAQEVFLRLLKYKDSDVVEHPQSYLFRIAENIVRERAERLRNKMPHDEDWLRELIWEGDCPEGELVKWSEIQRIRDAVSRLPERWRAILMLHINQDLDRKAIAKKLNLSMRIVRRDLGKAYIQLREDLSSSR
jgi:RNA polymerase sigma-70 factor (ECF subfamily)